MNKQSGKRKVESRNRGRRCAHARPSLHSAFHFPLSALRRSRHAVTLIELLITITIIATLAAAFLGASRSAMETARAARTKTTIAKIHGLLMERWASYATRRVDVDTSGLGSGGAAAFRRLEAVRELMKLEMPDRWSDVLGNSVPDNGPYTNISIASGYPSVVQNYPSLSSAYLRRLRGLNPVATGSTTQGNVIRRNQGAECLYLIIMLATGDGEARTLFSQQDIGDTDEDGAPEFLDGWGRPIEFIRWPVGFNSDLQPLTAPGIGNPDADHDPFDHFRRDPNAFRLVPLVYSSGSDGIFDVSAGQIALVGANPYDFARDELGALLLDAMGSSFYIGTQRDGDNDGDNWIDNIHNHLLDGR